MKNTNADHKSNQGNPNNPANQKVRDNRSNQGNPNNPAYRSSRRASQAGQGQKK